ALFGPDTDLGEPPEEGVGEPLGVGRGAVVRAEDPVRFGVEIEGCWLDRGGRGPTGARCVPQEVVEDEVEVVLADVGDRRFKHPHRTAPRARAGTGLRDERRPWITRS